ncbi:MAG: DegT/DnrJ/EryC1/StrS family aminotransferase, partial [Cyclobacteriaceae bacterium]|nr:DegT/DnrJ/EryC1/StrS family aminotransferase [Cyclobacteriaceae bacterium]
RAALHAQNIFPRRYFYPSLNTLPFLPESLRRPCPVSESVAQRVLALPLYPLLLRKDVERISSIINSIW